VSAPQRPEGARASPPRLLVRADADAAIGLGHVMRCLALAQALADECGGEAEFVMSSPQPAFTARAVREGMVVRALDAAAGGVEDAAETARRADGADWVVLDGYHFDGGYQRALVDAGLKLLAVDDHGHAGSYPAQLVLNQNFGAGPEGYGDRAPYTRLLLGPRHTLLRREFRSWPGTARSTPPVARRVLVTMGGSDPDNLSARVLAGLGDVAGPLEVQVLIGGANPHREALERAAAACPHPVRLAVDVLDVPERMAWAEVAVTAAGGSSRELACVGTPQIAIVLADNQRPAGRALGEQGLAESLGWHEDVSAGDIASAVAGLAADARRREELSRRGRELIDGRGALRVLGAMGLVSEVVAA
jgi:UDP-2,4-diacetamido-2,4,6-trideoxy-beta-L-altropyranose hydrolase